MLKLTMGGKVVADINGYKEPFNEASVHVMNFNELRRHSDVSLRCVLELVRRIQSRDLVLEAVNEDSILDAQHKGFNTGYETALNHHGIGLME